MFPLLLYLLSGLATGWQVLRAVRWAVWGRPVHPLEVVSLLGSLILIVAAVTSPFRPRRAAWLALVGALACWTFYVPALVQTYELAKTDQDVEVVFVQWTPRPGRLEVVGDRASHLSTAERAQLQGLGVSGTLRVVEDGLFGFSGERFYQLPVGTETGKPRRGRVVVVMKRQLETPVDLPQPHGGEVIYVQGDKDWTRFPATGPELKRTVRLEVARHTATHTWYSVELANGGRSGGTAYVWELPGQETK